MPQTMVNSAVAAAGTNTAPLASQREQAAPWWRQAVVYQVYPRSFADSNADGLGDIQGIISRADYLNELGIDAVWLSPFYPSALADGGYDVADYRNVDPRLGTLEDFDAMVAALHERGMRVVVDIVPNHTSDEHEWFQAALRSEPGSPERERYIFRNGKGPNGSEPPADWQSVFGGPAWTQTPDGQWYLHSFAKEQPDLNWNNREVRDDFLKTLKFWSDRGVDGFRIDVAHMLTKDLTEPLPTQAQLDALPQDGNHPLLDRDDVHEVYAEWRALFDSYDPPRTAVAEAWVAADRVPLYASPTSLGQSFNFDLVLADFEPGQFRKVVTHSLDVASRSGSTSTWVLSNHDVVRHPTRYGLPNPPRGEGQLRPDIRHGEQWLASGGIEPVLDRDKGLRRARAATLFALGLPGAMYLYQGEELGLHEVVEILPEQRQDPTFERTGRKEIGRDGCRVPLPWTKTGVAYGFGEHEPHLPQPTWFGEVSVEAQDGDSESTLEFYRRALSLRKQLQGPEEFEWKETSQSDVLAFSRPGGWSVITNFGEDSYDLSAADLGDAEVLISSAPVIDGKLPGEATVWVRGN